MVQFGPTRCAIHDRTIDAENTCERCEDEIAAWYEKYGDERVVTRFEVAAVLYGIASFLSVRSIDYRNIRPSDRRHLRTARDHAEEGADTILDPTLTFTSESAGNLIRNTETCIMLELQPTDLHDRFLRGILSELTSLLSSLAEMRDDVALPFPLPAMTPDMRQTTAETAESIWNSLSMRHPDIVPF